MYPKEDPRRRELVAELYVRGRVERLFYVAEQLETVLFEGLPHRAAALRQRLIRTRADTIHGSEEALLLRRLVRLRKVSFLSMAGIVLWIIGNVVYVFLTNQTVATRINAAALTISSIVAVVLFLELKHFNRRFLRIPSSGITQSRKP